MPTLKELKATAKEKGLKGYSSMSKAQLEELIATPTEVVLPPDITPLPDDSAVVEDLVEKTEGGALVDKAITNQEIREILRARGLKVTKKMNRPQLMAIYKGEQEPPAPPKRQANTWVQAVAEYRKENPGTSILIKAGTPDYQAVRKIQDRLKSQKQAVKKGKVRFEQ